MPIAGDFRYRRRVDLERTSRLRYVLGPWPFVPGQIIILGSLAFLVRAALVAGFTPKSASEFAADFLWLTLLGFLISTVAVGFMLLLGGWPWGDPQRRSFVPSRARYVTALVGSSALAAIGQVLVRYVSNDPVTGKGAFASIPVAFITVFAMMLFFVVVATSFTGYVRLRLSLQARQLQEQIDQLEHQRTLIVEAEQRVRREVATILHDDFQGELLRATLRLSRLADTTTPEHAESVREVVANLERLRGEGVRSLSRRLAPPIESIGFASALDELVRSYEGTIAVEVALDPEIEITLAGDSGEQPLALYRIIEQALLNAAAHGHARHVDISLTQTSGELRLTVDDDGQGLPATITQGTGTAIITSWVGVTGGTWSLAPAEQQGTRLVLTIPRG